MSYTDKLKAKIAETHYPDALTKLTRPGSVSFVSTPSKSISEKTTSPDNVAAGLQRLQSMPIPRGIAPATWAAVVADAVALVEQGWAAQALALGWSESDLFGAVTDPEGDPADDGLAAWLAGRNILALCDAFAAVDEGNGGQSYFYRGDTRSARLLWEIGR